MTAETWIVLGIAPVLLALVLQGRWRSDPAGPFMIVALDNHRFGAFSKAGAGLMIVTFMALMAGLIVLLRP